MKETKRRQKEAGLLVLPEAQKEKIRQSLLKNRDKARETTNAQFASEESRKNHSAIMRDYYAAHPEKRGKPPADNKRDPITGRIVKKKPVSNMSTLD